jgi:hypothetical protein
MIGLEYHLPTEYFRYRQDCLIKTIAILEEIAHLAQSTGAVIPQWDPLKFENASRYIAAIRHEHPSLLNDVGPMMLDVGDR